MSLLGRIGGALKGAVTGFVTGGPAGALGGAAIGLASSSGPRRPSIGTAVVPFAGPSATQLRSCPPGSFPGPLGSCVDLMPGGAGSGSGVLVSPGESRTIRGAMVGASGIVPERRNTTVRSCGRGMVLGADGLCYDKRTLRKDQRMWVPPRKPLLTGGELNAISKAARAANRVKATQKKLERLGLLKRPKVHRFTKADASRLLRK